MQANKLLLSLVLIFWSVMITGLSTISLVLGMTIAYMASGYPERRAAMETLGGILIARWIRLDRLRTRMRPRSAAPLAATTLTVP